MWLVVLAACPAEQLGIELPPGGAEAISHEDLRRDTRTLVEGPAATRFTERLGQMQMTPADAPAGTPEGTTCATRGPAAARGPAASAPAAAANPGGEPAGSAERGAGAPTTLLVAPFPADADTATAAAALVSVAKAWDLAGGPARRMTLCVLPTGAALAEVAAGLGPEALVVGPLAAGQATFTPGAGHAATFAADPADPTRPAERVNYTDLQARVKLLFERV